MHHSSPPTEVRKVDLPFQVQANGQRFALRLRGVGQGFGVAPQPGPLRPGDLAVLRPLAEDSEEADLLQIYARVAEPREQKRFVVLTWEKAISPEGITPLLSFVTSKLKMSLGLDESELEEMVDGELVTLDFRTYKLTAPIKGQLGMFE